MAPVGKLGHLESLRGLAALAVVATHLVWAFAQPPPPAKPTQPEWPTGVATLRGVPQLAAKILYWPVKQGRLAVFVFFALSGVVLAQSYLNSGRVTDLQSATLRRHLRLAVPAVASSVLAWGLWAGGCRRTTEAAEVLRTAGVPTQWFTLVEQPPTPSLIGAVREAGFDLYFAPNPLAPLALHNPVLWTMRVEFFGSLVVFAFLGVFGPHRRVLMLAAGTAVLFALAGRVEMALFPAGVAVAVAARRGVWFPTYIGLTAVVLGLYLGGNYGAYDPRLTGRYKPGEPGCAAGAVLIVAAVTLTPWLGRVLRWRPMVWLGSISFGLYLVHLLVILTAGAGVLADVMPRRGWGWAVIAASVVTVALSLIGGWAMTYVADRPAVWLGRRFAAWVLGRPPRLESLAPVADNAGTSSVTPAVWGRT